MKNQYEKSSYALPGSDVTKRIVKSSHPSSTKRTVIQASFSDFTKRHSPHCSGSVFTILTKRSAQHWFSLIMRTLNSAYSFGSVTTLTFPNSETVLVSKPYSFVILQLTTRACASAAQAIKANDNINSKRFMVQK